MTSDKARIRKSYDQAAQDKLRLDNAVRAMLQHADTRFYLNWLIEIGKVGSQPFTANALQTSFACGELNVGNQIWAHILEVDTAGYVQMRQEIEDERRNRTNGTGRTYAEPTSADEPDTDEPRTYGDAD